ncbi:hypothetical protein CF386_09320 [Paraphotobacterium marinum]|uniref:Uncharacterized protein n=1 Tax=Paraphotobacterium marinum TaxID=1755811 RepID=A0A220VG85_9GAMM|nr:nitronate monooxygenase [Paraphotobacterium marinum]ASK79260.1 hypothetical protein CF386_09320 [Paraphotobacterium marinum]
MNYRKPSHPIIEKLDLKIPLFIAPMLGVTSEALIISASQEKTFSFLPTGASEKLSKDIIQEIYENIVSKGNSDYIGIAIDMNRLKVDDSFFDFVLSLKPKAIWFSFGEVSSYIKKCKQNNVLAFTQLNTFKEMQDAIDADVDVIVAQGLEAGGHTGNKNSIVSLLPNIKDYLGKIKKTNQIAVLAAGGIVDSRTFKAARVLGADGVVMGTRFALSYESDYPERYKNNILNVKNNFDATLLSYEADLIMGRKKHSHQGRALINNMINNTVTQNLTENNLSETQKKYQQAIKNHNVAYEIIWCSQNVGLIKKLLSVRDIIKQIKDQLE